MPLYAIFHEGRPGQIAFAVAHCTAGDVLIALACYLVASAVMRDPVWPWHRPGGGVAVAIVTGVAHTVFSEWLNVSVRGSWAYAQVDLNQYAAFWFDHASRWMRPFSQPRSWQRLAVIALAAVAILVLRPICEAAEPLERGAAHSHAGWQQDQRGEPQPCCLSIEDGSVIPAAVAVPGLVKLSPVLPLRAFVQYGSPARAPATAHRPPPRALSYHARSARLLL